MTSAATFLAFHRIRADACVIEVGLGGRFDATNVLDGQAARGIATLGIDQREPLLVPEAERPPIRFQGSPLKRPDRLPGRAAGNPGLSPGVTRTVIEQAMQAGAKPRCAISTGLPISERPSNTAIGMALLLAPLPALAGAHQADNAALAVAMLRPSG
ncbi:MAG: hypothetical protein R3E03_05455 [Novosphingobium sp.]